MTVRLTDTAIQAATTRAAKSSKRIDLSDAALPGLRLRVSSNGKRPWVLACRDPLGRMRRFPLGDYPGMGISQARDAARTMRVAVRGGDDPIADARRKRVMGREAREGIGTLAAVLDIYAKQRGSGLKSWPECRRRIDHVFASHLAMPLATVRSSDLQMTADAHSSQQSAAAAVRYIRPVLKWAAQRGYVSADVPVVHPPATVRRRDRVLSREEMQAILPVLRVSTRPYAAALRFMLLTLARREEVAQARWQDVNLETGTWSIRNTKNKQPHVVPLSSQAQALLRERRPEAPIPDALVFSTSTGAALGNWDRETKALQEASKTGGWSRHDLRRSGATMLGEMGELPDIVEAALNHVSIRSALAATYNRSRYRPQV
ncbi:MAG: site-specific integrase, partial [Acetobacteraceae bacterium]|nr:site-specific integrase [Acetobacteraceae bacterium]